MPSRSSVLRTVNAYIIYWLAGETASVGKKEICLARVIHRNMLTWLQPSIVFFDISNIKPVAMESWLILLLFSSVCFGQELLSYDYYTYDYSYTDVECKYPDAFVNRSTITIGEPLLEKNGSEWKLIYNITWQPPDPPQANFTYKVKASQATTNGTSLQAWSPSMCDQELLLAVDVEAPYYVVELLFTYSSLFQVVPAVDGVMASTKPQKIIFNTPDCYEATKDADFCAKQDVKYCGAPRDLRVLNVTKFLKTQLVSPYFEWLSPIQINADYKLSLYSVTINWANGTKVQGKTVRHQTNKTKHSWIADQTGSDDREIQEGALYVFKVTPIVSSPKRTTEGITGELKFWANITDVVTAAPTTTDAPIYITNPPSRTGLAINLVIVFCLIVAAILIFAIIAKRKGLFEMDTGEEVFYRIDRAKTNIYTEPLMQVDPVLKPKEVKHDKITLQQELGKGQFGIVYKGLVYGISGDEEYVEAAVKTTKDGAFDDVKEDLLEEMKLMIQLGSHPNLMTLLACCTQREPYYLITEFMEYGDLLNFLRRCREKENGEKDNIYNVGEMEQLGIAHQIAKGMAYVQEERYYHGDLAARNVLVGRGLTIKISDFGLADDIYSRGYKRREQEQKIPIKWCSIEAILNGICSSEGDVWSYGVVLYEIFTLGGTPYPGIAGRFLVAQLREGYRMDQPEGCPDEIYKIMLQCWEEVAESRPRFNDISQSVDAMLVERSDYLCFDMEGECEDNAEDGSSRPLSVPNIYVRAPGNMETSENFAPIIEEDNEIGLEELQEIIHSENKADIKRDANDNV